MKKAFLFALMITLLLSACNGLFHPRADMEATAIAARYSNPAGEQTDQYAPTGIPVPLDAEPSTSGQPGEQTTDQPGGASSDRTDYYTLTQEELIAMITTTVNEAVGAAEIVANECITSTTDGELTNEEVAAVQGYQVSADEALASAQKLTTAYMQIYGEYATEMLDAINQIDGDLAAMSTNLQEISSILAQGAQAATASVDQLNQAADLIRERINTALDMTGQLENMTPVVLAMQEENALNMASNLDADNRAQALEYTRDFSTALRQSMSDRKISPEELDRIAQLGAEARFALLKFDLGEEGGISTLLDQLVSLAARGEYPRIIPALDEFDQALPSS